MRSSWSNRPLDSFPTLSPCTARGGTDLHAVPIRVDNPVDGNYMFQYRVGTQKRTENVIMQRYPSTLKEALSPGPQGYLLAASLLFGPLPALAQENAAAEPWEFEANFYLWGAGIGMETANGNEVDISFSDIISNFDMGLMGGMSAQRGRWSLLSDVIYLHIEQKTDLKGGRLGLVEGTRADVDVKSWIITAAGGYAVVDNESTRVDLLGGVRYLWLESDLDLDLRRGGERQFSDAADVWDGIVGVRGRTWLAPQWYLTFYADVGTGQTDLTWQALAGINYRFRSLDVGVGYRYLDWNFDSDSPFNNLDVSGPYAGVRLQF